MLCYSYNQDLKILLNTWIIWVLGRWNLDVAFLVLQGYVQSQKEIERSVKMATMLLQHGCDASVKDANGMTPLMFAIQKVSLTSYISHR